MTALLAGMSTVEAQTVSGVNVDSYTMQRDGSHVILDMNIDISQLKVKSANAVILTPHIVRDTMSVALKSVGLYGRNRDFFNQRNEELALTNSEDITYRRSKAPEMVTYRAIVPYEAWMDGCQLVFQRKDCGCNNAVTGTEGTILVDRFPLEPYIPTLVYIRPEAERVKTRELSGTAYIDFAMSKMNIDPALRNNSEEIAKITNSIDVVKADADATITSITIKGYASPESSYANNTRLAKGRTESLKSYVEALYDFDSDIFITDYEPEDWAGLERFVEASTLKNRDNILAIIRSESEPDHKEWVLKSSYPQEYAHLFANCYPALRHSDYAITYTLRHYSDPVEIAKIMATAPQKLSLDEFYILAQTYESGSTELNELWETAVRMYPEDEIANLNAANSAIDKGDFKRAERYLDKAGDRAEVDYARGCIEILQGNYEASLPHLQKAIEGGIEEAAPALEAAENHWKVKCNNNK